MIGEARLARSVYSDRGNEIEMKRGVHRRTATIDPHRRESRNWKRNDSNNKLDGSPQQQHQRRPADEEERQQNLRVNFAVALIVLMMLGGFPRGCRQRIFPRILGGVLQIVKVLQRARAQ